MEAAWPVRDVHSAKDAASIAISEAGKRLNPKHSYVDVSLGSAKCPGCGEGQDAVLLVAGWAMVGLTLEMTVYNAQGREHAERIAKKEIGTAFGNIPLRVCSTDPVPEGETTR
jgi:uncharacterized protein (UPF0212 family)